MEFIKVIVAAIYYVHESRAALTKALAWPFVAFVFIEAIGYFRILGSLSFLMAIIGMVIQAIFAITIHRVLLLGPDSVSKWGITSWTKRETFFVLHVIAFWIMFIPIMLLGLIPVLGGIAAFIIICWFAGRLSLVFPGIAVDKGVSFRLSWQLTQAHQMLMFLVVIVFPILLAIPTIILNFFPNTFLLSSLLSTFVVVFEVAALSMAYQLIISKAYEND